MGTLEYPEVPFGVQNPKVLHSTAQNQLTSASEGAGECSRKKKMKRSQTGRSNFKEASEHTFSERKIIMQSIGIIK